MPTGTEIIALFASLGAILLLLFAIRRAASKQLREGERRKQLPEGGRDAKARGEAGPARAKRPKQQPKPKAARAAKQPPGAEPEADEVEEPEEAAVEPAEEEATDLRDGLARTRGGFVARLGRLFAKKKIDDDLLDQLEEVLLTADIGPKTAERLFQSIKSELKKSQLSDAELIWRRIRDLSREILRVEAPPLDFDGHRPFVLLIVGVNGVGKTTTIGKLAHRLHADGKKVLLAAGDTFRAAAVEQLEVWGERAGALLVKGKEGGDPSSIIFDAINRATAEGYDVVIADTAGRLHTKVDLMEELRKVHRVCGKALEGAPHETILVVDATTGQNAIAQAQLFKEATDITGIVLTKLDGTAKGGVILGICDELGVPVRFIGIGEKIADLRPFDPDAFVRALYGSEGPEQTVAPSSAAN